MTNHASPKSRTLLTVKDVLKSTEFYCDLLDLTALGKTPDETHGNVYNRHYHGDELVLQLHVWDIENHPNMTDADKGPAGHGVLIWFEIADIQKKHKVAQKLGASIIIPPQVNPNSGDVELWLRDDDGYMIVLSEPSDERIAQDQRLSN